MTDLLKSYRGDKANAIVTSDGCDATFWRLQSPPILVKCHSPQELHLFFEVFMPEVHSSHHSAATLNNPLSPSARDVVRVGSRRWFLQTGLAGLAGISLADTLRLRAAADSREPRAVILFWLSGGPSQIDTWDPNPDAPI